MGSVGMYREPMFDEAATEGAATTTHGITTDPNALTRMILAATMPSQRQIMGDIFRAASIQGKRTGGINPNLMAMQLIEPYAKESGRSAAQAGATALTQSEANKKFVAQLNEQVRQFNERLAQQAEQFGTEMGLREKQFGLQEEQFGLQEDELELYKQKLAEAVRQFDETMGAREKTQDIDTMLKLLPTWLQGLMSGQSEEFFTTLPFEEYGLDIPGGGLLKGDEWQNLSERYPKVGPKYETNTGTRTTTQGSPASYTVGTGGPTTLEHYIELMNQPRGWAGDPKNYTGKMLSTGSGAVPTSQDLYNILVNQARK